MKFNVTSSAEEATAPVRSPQSSPSSAYPHDSFASRADFHPPTPDEAPDSAHTSTNAHLLTLPPPIPPPEDLPGPALEIPDFPPPGHIVDEAELDASDDRDPPQSLGERIRLKLKENQPVVNTFIAGGLAGAASRTVVSPLERLKIILQVQASQGHGGEAYGGVWSSLVRMWKNEGFAGFMKGNGINVVRILPYSALQFTSYGAFKNALQQWSGEPVLSTPLRLLSGAGAGIVAVSATYPLDLVRARLSIATANMASAGSTSAFSKGDAEMGIWGMTKKVYKTEGGIRGLYRGVLATAVGVAPYVSLNFFGYETLKGIILPGDREYGDFEFAFRKLASGGCAGAFSLMFTHPMDVLRRKMQVAGLKSLGQPNVGAIETLKLMIKNDGFWRGLYKGLVPNLIKIVPSMAVSFYTFDTVNDLLSKWTRTDELDEWA